MNRFYAVESFMTPTGSSADHRLNVPRHEFGIVLKELAGELKKLGLNINAKSMKTSNHLWVKTVAEDLMKDKGQSIIIGGSDLSPELHCLIAGINSQLEAPIDYYPLDRSHVTSMTDFKALCEKMRKGLVDNLIILGGNPVYDAPADYNFEGGLSNVKSSVHLSDFYDETSKHCQWNIAQSHFFEAWGDAMTYDGYASVIQPQIRPLFDSRSALQVLNPVVFKEDRSSYDTIKKIWKTRRYWENDFVFIFG